MTSADRAGISIVCVYNNVDVRAECLDRSIDAYAGDADIDYIPIDNTAHAFSSAGSALNHGARQARHGLVAFVHQDVYLHSIDRLVAAGMWFENAEWALLGANGVRSGGENVGRMRDRAQIIGTHAPFPVAVDSVDEVLFLIPRELVLEHPLTEDPELAWHAYAVEYAARLRAMGGRVGALDLGITHNSLTINLDKLDVAHRRVGDRYPELLPLHTTCGTVGSRPSRLRGRPFVRRHAWRLRWLRHSLLAWRARQRMDAPVVLSDIRHEIDLLPFSNESPLHLFNLDRSGGFVEFTDGALQLTRYGRPVTMSAVGSMPDLLATVSELPADCRILIVGVELSDLSDLQATREERRWLVGIHPAEIWVLGGAGAGELPDQWARPEAVPLGLHAARQG